MRFERPRRRPVSWLHGRRHEGPIQPAEANANPLRGVAFVSWATGTGAKTPAGLDRIQTKYIFE